jgi:hypothetical protein
MTPVTVSSQKAGAFVAWGGAGQSPCPVVAKGFYRPDADASENLSIPGVEWWCEPGEAVLSYAVEVPAAHYVRRNNPDCPDGWQRHYADLAARALRAASAYQASMEMPQGLALSMVADWLAPLAERDETGTVRRIVDGLTGDYSTCRVLGIAVPEGRRITRVQTTLVASATARPLGAHCGLFRTTSTPPPDHGCVADNPAADDVAAGIVFEDYRISEGSVTVTVKSWSGDPPRVVRFRVYYIP